MERPKPKVSCSVRVAEPAKRTVFRSGAKGKRTGVKVQGAQGRLKGRGCANLPTFLDI